MDAPAVPAKEEEDQQQEQSEEAEEQREDVSQRQCREVFHLFDRGAGWMLTKDLGSALRSLGQIPSEHEIEAMLSRLEQDDIYDKGHTKLSFQQFHQVVQENFEKKADIREMVLDSFKALDPQKTGLVEAAQLTTLLTSIGEVLNTADVKELLQEAGVNKQGKVDYVKFIDSVINFDLASTGDAPAKSEAADTHKGKKKR